MKNVMRSGLLALAAMVFWAFDMPAAYAQRDVGCENYNRRIYNMVVDMIEAEERQTNAAISSRRADLRELVENASYDSPGDRERALRNHDRNTRLQISQNTRYYRSLRTIANRDRRAAIAACSVWIVENDEGGGSSGGGGNGGGNGNSSSGSTLTVSSSTSNKKTIVTIEEVCTDDTCEQDAG
ncbi:MAG: hypothetical protein OXI17_15790 [Gammaproteobacteria bacterium]|nr:hypothetical protein [Gammaproteobacteria bacterium]